MFSQQSNNLSEVTGQLPDGFWFCVGIFPFCVGSSSISTACSIKVILSQDLCRVTIVFEGISNGRLDVCELFEKSCSCAEVL